jgi:hypothetical protein
MSTLMMVTTWPDGWVVVAAFTAGAVLAAAWGRRAAGQRIDAARERTVDLLRHHVHRPLVTAYRHAVTEGDTALATELHAALAASEDLTPEAPRSGDVGELVADCIVRARAACGSEVPVTVSAPRPGLVLKRTARASFEEVVHEAVLNALRHGAGAVRVALALGAGDLVVVVHNAYPEPGDELVLVTPAPGEQRGVAMMTRTLARAGGSLAVLPTASDHTVVLRWPASAIAGARERSDSIPAGHAG